MKPGLVVGRLKEMKGLIAEIIYVIKLMERTGRDIACTISENRKQDVYIKLLMYLCLPQQQAVSQLHEQLSICSGI
jgi:hypothetical protein